MDPDVHRRRGLKNIMILYSQDSSRCIDASNTCLKQWYCSLLRFISIDIYTYTCVDIDLDIDIDVKDYVDIDIVLILQRLELMDHLSDPLQAQRLRRPLAGALAARGGSQRGSGKAPLVLGSPKGDLAESGVLFVGVPTTRGLYLRASAFWKVPFRERSWSKVWVQCARTEIRCVSMFQCVFAIYIDLCCMYMDMHLLTHDHEVPFATRCNLDRWQVVETDKCENVRTGAGSVDAAGIPAQFSGFLFGTSISQRLTIRGFPYPAPWCCSQPMPPA